MGFVVAAHERLVASEKSKGVEAIGDGRAMCPIASATDA